MAVDPRDGRVVDTLRFADRPLAGKLAGWGDAHMGLLLGVVNQVALAALAPAVVGAGRLGLPHVVEAV